MGDLVAYKRESYISVSDWLSEPDLVTESSARSMEGGVWDGDIGQEMDLHMYDLTLSQIMYSSEPNHLNINY